MIRQNVSVARQVLLLFGFGLLVFVTFVSSAGAGSPLLVGANLDGGTDDLTEIAQFQSNSGRHLDIVSVPMPWYCKSCDIPGYIPWAGFSSWIDLVNANGSAPMLTWEPVNDDGTAIAGGAGCPQYIASAASSDPVIGFITAMAASVAADGRLIYFRPMHEMNQTGWPWSIGPNAACPGGRITNANYVAGWRRIVSIFAAAGATNAKFVWCVANSNVGGYGSFRGTYPGAAYVNYVGVDGYNWGSASWGWMTFDKVFRSVYAALSPLNIPMIIAEFSSSEIGGSKASWITAAFAKIQGGSYPRIVASLWFNRDIPEQPDWPIESSSAATAAYAAAMATIDYPAAKLLASPSTVTADASSVLRWSSTHATSCTGTNFHTGNATSGAVSISPSHSASYSISCTGARGAATAHADVTVVSSPTVDPLGFSVHH
jgi:endoglucanase